jgi:6-pyruvoyltetrahydropterin/6-carboxytetrahydropterin synthase
MFELSAESDFSASHLLEGYDGPCGRLHGHNYRVQVTVEAEDLDDLGMAFDLRVLKRALRETLAQLDHGHLNEHPAFAGIPPSAENIAKFVFQAMQPAVQDATHPDAHLREVRVAESEHSWITYRPERGRGSGVGGQG